MIFSSSEYLPNPEERIEHLRKIVGGRPVAILALGPSINELEKKISQLNHADICYFGFNSFLPEEHILQKINKRFSIFMLSSREGMPGTMDSIIDFLSRDDSNLYISSFWRNTFELLGDSFNINDFITTYNEKLLFFTLSYDRTVPNTSQPLHFVSGNSLQIAIQLALIGKASKIILFGADGYCRDIVKHYYRSSEYNPGPETPPDLTRDTMLCFNPILPIAVRNTLTSYKLPPVEILNCSPGSEYTPFPIISYDVAFEIMSGKSVFDRKSDLRVSRLSVISSLELIAENDSLSSIQSQSYTNFENILLRKADDDSTLPDVGHCSNVRIADQTSRTWHQGLRSIVTESRGEYLTFCTGTNSYANPDWFNICVDILDNHPDVSLVYGLTQNVSESNGAPGNIQHDDFLRTPPPQGSAFRNFWRNNPLILPAGNMCMRKDVFEKCFPAMDCELSDETAWFLFTYKFVMSGYEPFFVPLIANYHRTFIDQGGHRPEGSGDHMHLPYYAPLTDVPDNGSILRDAIKVLDGSTARPHILIVSEKWFDGTPAGGSTNSEHNLWGSLATSGLATFDLIHFDEYNYYGKGNPDAALLDLYKSKRPDLVFISWLATTDRHANPSFRTLDIIKSFGTPVATIFWDSANPANMDIAESVVPHVDLILLADSTTAYLTSTKRFDKYLPIWCPQDTSLYNNPNYTRDVDVCFLGSVNTHPERSRALSALMSCNIKVYVGGGRQEQPVPVEQYADMFKRSKIVLNFSRHAYGYYQHKGRVFEATLCGALLLESENPETEKWLVPMLDYVPFKEERDLVDKVLYFLAHDNERQKIANRGCAKATELYTGETFWRTVLNKLVHLS